jgi:predicted O-methyltransferase YrrM
VNVWSRLVHRPRKVAAALLALARIRRAGELSPEDAFAFVQSASWYGSQLHATQESEEIVWLLQQLEQERPRIVVEIGTDNGGTLFLWSRIAAADALLVAIDIRPLGILGARTPWALVRRGFARGRQRVVLLMPRDSHAESTVDELRGVLGGRPVDFLFIDGDHEYESITRDYELYSRLVRPGGLIAFHDVSPVPAPGTDGTARFWAEFKEHHETSERVVRTDGGYGIGLFRVPG